MTASTASSNTRTITRNSFWYAFDASVMTMMMLITSVPVARVLGPEVLGYFIYLLFITGIAQRLANVGIPATAGKYIAEYLGRGEADVAHGVFRATLKHQAVISAIVTAAGCILVYYLGDPRYRFISLMVVVSMWPNMVNNIPAQANVGAENLRANIPASLIAAFIYFALVMFTLAFHWGLTGLASAILGSRTAEAIVRYVGVRRWITAVPPRPLSAELRRRMAGFSRQNLVLLALGLVVWDRSEVLFLKHFCDVRQVAFYSLAFSITNQLLMAPRALSGSIGVTMLAQYGRDRSRLQSLMQNATRYVSLITVPMFLGLAAVGDPLIRMVYGPSYIAVIPVLWILCISSIPRAFQTYSESLLQATESQKFMVKWLVFSAAINLLADWQLIPRYGAVGAGLANGLAQTLAVAGLWFKANSLVKVSPPNRLLRKLVLSCGLMGAVALPTAWIRPAALGLIAGIIVGVIALAVCLRFTKCLEWEDRLRLEKLGARGPRLVRRLLERLFEFLVPLRDAPSAAE